MLSYREGSVKAGKVNIHYYRTGGIKTPFILLHGATDNGLCWTRTAEMLAHDYDIIMPDALGHGLSDRFNNDTTSTNSADEVAALIKELELRKPFIIGHSMGAGTAANLAAKYQSIPNAIILEDPGWGMPLAADNPEARKQAEVMRTSMANLHNLSLEELLKESRKRDPSWDEEERLPWAKAKQQFDPALFSRIAANHQPYTEIIPKIKCPTLLICAEKGIVTRDIAENAAKLWASKKPFKWVMIKGAGHNIRREKFTEFYKAVTDFLKDNNIK
jgi:N-formylmaleamate deformylase